MISYFNEYLSKCTVEVCVQSVLIYLTAPQLVINPKMEVIDYNKIELPESCESIRGYSAVVPRYKAVRLSGNTHPTTFKNLSLKIFMFLRVFLCF